MDNDKSEKPGKDNKEKLKALRAERKELIAKNRELLKKQNDEKGLIQKGLKTGEKTIPELAKETGLKGDLILYYLSAMRKYGQVEEAGHAGAYFKYKLVESLKK